MLLPQHYYESTPDDHSGNHSDGQHLCHQQRSGIYGEGAGSIPVEAGIGSQGIKAEDQPGKKRSTELDTLIKTLYESYAMGKITEKRFEMLSADYEKEQAALEEIIAADIAELEVFTTDKDRAQQFLSIAKRYTDFSQLTTPMINEFVDKILVHAPEKIDGERTMEIEIYLKFIGKFDSPMPEPTPEELAAEEKARKKRAAERAKYERRKERKRQQKLEAERQSQAAENTDAPEEETA